MKKRLCKNKVLILPTFVLGYKINEIILLSRESKSKMRNVSEKFFRHSRKDSQEFTFV